MNNIQYHSNGAYKVIDALVKLTDNKQQLHEACRLLGNGKDSGELEVNIEHLRRYVTALELASMKDCVL